MTRPHAESHRRIKLIAGELERLLTRLRSLPEGDRARVTAEVTQAAQSARKQPELLDWALFLETHEAIVARGGALSLLQSAVGLATGSLVTLAAEDWVLARAWKVPWFRRTQRPRDTRPGPVARSVELDGRRPRAIVVTPDGLRGLGPSPSKAHPGSLELWNLETGQLVAASPPRKAHVEAIALLPDGNGFVAGFDDGLVERWGLEPLSPSRPLAQHEGPVYRLVVAASGQVAASVGADGVRVFDPRDGRALARVPSEPGHAFRAALSPSGEVLALGSSDGQIALLDAATGQLRTKTRAHEGQVLELLITRTQVVSAGVDGALRFWELGSLEPAPGPSQGGSAVTALAEAGEGSLVWGDGAGEVKSSSGLSAQTGEGVTSVAVLPSGDTAAGGAEGWVRLFDAQGAPAGQVLAHDGRVTSVVPHGSEGRVCSVGDDGAIRVLEARGAKEQAPIASRSVQAIDAEGGRALCLTVNNELELWDLTEGRRLKRLCSLGDRARLAGARLESGQVLVESFRDRLTLLESAHPLPYKRALGLLDLDKGDIARAFEPHDRSTRAVAFHPDGKRAVAGGGDRRVRVLDLQTGSCLFSLEGHAAPVSAVALHPDGKRAVSAGWDGQLCVWNIDRGKRLARHDLSVEGPFWSLVLPDDNDTVTVGAASGLIATFDLESGRRLRSASEHAADVRALALSDDGAWLASASEDRTLRFWSARSLKPICRWDSPSPVVGCQFLPDGRIALWHPRGEPYYLKFNDWGLGED